MRNYQKARTGKKPRRLGNGQGRRTTAADTAYLHAHGIRVRPQVLDEMIATAVDDLQRSLYGDSADDLPMAEAEVLEQGGFDLAPRPAGRRDPVARTAAEYAALLETSLSSSEAATRLGVDASRVRQRLGERTLYGVHHGPRWLLPRFQFADGSEVPGLAEVLPRLDPELHPLYVLRWFMLPSPDLHDEELDRDLSPRDWLLLGRPASTVARLAATL